MVITLYVYPVLPAAAAGSVVIVPPVPTVPLNCIGSGSASIASFTALDVGTVVSVVPRVVTIVLLEVLIPVVPLPKTIALFVRLEPVTVPLFLVKPQPETVVSVTASGIVGLLSISANPLVAFQSDCTLLTFASMRSFKSFIELERTS